MENIKYISLLETIDRLSTSVTSDKKVNFSVSISQLGTLQDVTRKLKIEINRCSLHGEIADSEYLDLMNRLDCKERLANQKANRTVRYCAIKRSIPNRKHRARLAFGVYADLLKNVTPAIRAVMRVIEIECLKHGVCTRSVKEIGDIAGVGRSTVQYAMRILSKAALVAVGIRKVRNAPNMTNVIRITSAQWLETLKMPSSLSSISSIMKLSTVGGGLKKASSLLDSKYIMDAFYREMSKALTYVKPALRFSRI